MTHWIWLNVCCRHCKVEWCCVLPSTTASYFTYQYRKWQVWQRTASSSFIIRFPCYTQVGRFPPLKLLQLVHSSAHSFFSPRNFKSCWTHSSHVLHAWGFWSKLIYSRMPFLTPTILFLPGLEPAQWCAGLHTPKWKRGKCRLQRLWMRISLERFNLGKRNFAGQRYLGQYGSQICRIWHH